MSDVSSNPLGKLIGRATRVGAALLGQKGILRSLKQEHAEAEALFRRLQASHDAGERAQVYHTLRGELLAHTEAEEATFYTAISHHAMTEPLARDGAQEHQVVLDVLRRLDALEPDSEPWDAELKKLHRLVSEHVEHEETTVFSMAQDVLDTDQLEQLESQFLALKQVALKNHI